MYDWDCNSKPLKNGISQEIIADSEREIKTIREEGKAEAIRIAQEEFQEKALQAKKMEVYQIWFEDLLKQAKIQSNL